MASNLAATLLGIVASFNERQVLIEIRDGTLASIDRANASDNFVMWAGIAFLASYVFAIVAFLLWFSRAYKNLSTWRNVEHRTGWAVGAWFVPFLNFYRPYKIAEEIVRSSPDPATYVTPRLLRFWWAAFLGSSLIDRVWFRQEAVTVQNLIDQNAISLVGSAVWIVAGVALMRIMSDSTKAQEARMSPVSSLIS